MACQSFNLTRQNKIWARENFDGSPKNSIGHIKNPFEVIDHLTKMGAFGTRRSLGCVGASGVTKTFLVASVIVLGASKIGLGMCKK